MTINLSPNPNPHVMSSSPKSKPNNFSDSTPLLLSPSNPLPLYSSTPLLLYSSTPLPLYPSTHLPIYPSTHLPLYSSTPLLHHLSTPLPLYLDKGKSKQWNVLLSERSNTWITLQSSKFHFKKSGFIFLEVFTNVLNYSIKPSNP